MRRAWPQTARASLCAFDHLLVLALQLHAEIVASNSQSEPSQPAKVSAHVKAQSLQVAAQSLEAQAEMQTLQDRARVHGEALADAQAQAEELSAQAQAHAQAHANASVNAGRLVAHSSMGGFLRIPSGLAAP